MPEMVRGFGVRPRQVEGKQGLHRIVRLSHLVVILLLVTSLGIALVPPGTFNPNVDPNSNAGFRDVMLPRLTVIAASVDEVESLVSNRSRNILALQGRATSIETVVAQIDDYLASVENEDEHPAAVEHYELGRDDVLAAIDEAQSAMRSFDFESIPELIPLFADGAEHLRKAVALLEDAEPAGSS